MTAHDSDDLRDLESQLSAELHLSAQSLSAAGDPNRAIARSAQRRQRRSMAGAAAGLVAVGGLAVAAVNLRPESTNEVVVAAGGAEQVGSPGPLSLEWRAVDAAVDWPTASFVAADGYRYALSTAPGTRYSDAAGDVYTPVPQAIYRTSDGENWDVVAQDGPHLGTLAERDGVLYAVSTSTDASGAVVSQVLSSTDGSTWSAADVALDFTPDGDPNGLLYPAGTPSLSLAVGDDQLIASAVRYRWFDDQKLAAYLGVTAPSAYSELIDDGSGETKVVLRDYTECDAAWQRLESTATTTSPTSAADDASGTSAGDVALERDGTPSACLDLPIVAESSLTDLGIVGDLVESRAAVSTDGSTWAPIEVPGASIWFAGGQFLTATYGNFGVADLYRSSDGVAWSPVDTGAADSIEILGTSKDLLVGRAYHEDTGVATLALSSDGGATWRELDASDVSPGTDSTSFFSSMAAGDLGIVVAFAGDGDSYSPQSWTIATSADGVTWTSLPASDVEGLDSGYPGWAFVDADHLGVVFSGAKRNNDGTVGAVTVLGTPTR